MSELTKEIVRLASEANKAANAWRETVDSPVIGLPQSTNNALAAAQALAAAVDKLTTAIADEEA